MTEEPYLTPLTSFKTGVEAAPIKTYPVLARGKDELRDVCFFSFFFFFLKNNFNIL